MSGKTGKRTKNSTTKTTIVASLAGTASAIDQAKTFEDASASGTLIRMLTPENA